MKRGLICLATAMALLIPTVSFSRAPQTKIVAHRGYWNCEEGGYARNSVAALKAAQNAGFWGSEFDVNMTEDEVLLVFHDSSIGGKKIENNPYSEFSSVRLENGEAIPTLDDYLKQAVSGPEIVLVLELKSHSDPEKERRAADLCIARLKEYGLYSPEKVMFISFSLDACRYLAKKAQGFTVQYLGSNLDPDQLAGYGISGIDTQHGFLRMHQGWIDMARKQRMSINTWTVNDEKDIRNMIGLGVDMITTDNPALAYGILQQL